MRLNLTQKGLILVSVPLVFGLLFFIALCTMLSQAEVKATQAKQSRDIISKVGYLTGHFVDAGTAIAAYSYMCRRNDQEASSALSKYEEAVSQIPGIYRDLQELSAGLPQQAAHVTRLQDLGRRLLDYFEQYRMDSSNGSGLGGLLKGFQLRKKMQEPLSREVALMTQELQQAEGENANQEKFWQSLTKSLLYVGIVVNIVITLMLAVFFSRGISSRLRILTDNAMRLASRRELNHQISGTDEIAQLDRVFHQMADSLISAERDKQAFVSMISHDLRTPLTSLHGTLALIATDKYGALSEQGKTRVVKAEASLERLIKLINELLEIERMEAGMVKLQCRNVEIQSVIEQSIDSIGAYSEQHGVSISAVATDATLYADPDRLTQVLVNLLSNAVKFSPKGSSVHIAVEKSPRWLKISVRDEGRGIPTQAIRAIFDRFKQVRDSDAKKQSGAGLGLAISKSIIEAHEGEIGVLSEEGKGSTFWFRLPVKEVV